MNFFCKMAGTWSTSASDDHLNKVVTSIRDRLNQPSEKSIDCHLQKAPDKLYKIHREAFWPKQVSIGPFYHYGKQWKVIEDYKWRYLESFLGQTQKSLGECVEFIKELEMPTRSCYLENIDLNSDEFIQMALVDGAFIIELFLLNRFPLKRAENDVIFNERKKWMIDNVRRDISLMENQLPFFVLENLFNFAFGSQLGEFPSLLALAYDFFSSRGNLKAERIFGSNVMHLLDALRLWYLPAPQEAQGAGWQKTEAIPRASHLRAAGVKFKQGESNCLFDIYFKGGVLYIPCLRLFPGTESFLRNVTAFEHSHYNDDSYFIDYVAFLGNLMDTAADAKLLIKKRIINTENWLGHDETLGEDDEALANLFKSFGKESRFWTRNSKFCSVRQKLKAYCSSHWHGLKVRMKRNSVSKKQL